MSKKFLIPSLLAAGFGQTDPLQAALTSATSTNKDDPNQAKLFQQYKQDHIYTLAQHRSHSSHSSHSSHRSGSSGGHYSHSSHRSSTGGYSTPSYNPSPVYTPPAPQPVYRPPAPPSPSGNSTSTGRTSGTKVQPLLSSPVTTENGETKLIATENGETRLVSLGGRSALFKTIVMHVQVALMGQGLFDGPIDGDVGPKTRAALRTFQGSHGLAVTGTITPQTLDALHVPTQK
jgi:His-Xaa-Ser repeat protein HxsA